MGSIVDYETTSLFSQHYKPNNTKSFIWLANKTFFKKKHFLKRNGNYIITKHLISFPRKIIKMPLKKYRIKKFV